MDSKILALILVLVVVVVVVIVAVVFLMKPGATSGTGGAQPGGGLPGTGGTQGGGTPSTGGTQSGGTPGAGTEGQGTVDMLAIMNSGVPYQCTISMDNPMGAGGKVQVTTYIKGQKMKVSGTDFGTGQGGEAIIDIAAKKMWVWTMVEGQQQCFYMDFSNLPEGQEAFDPEELKNLPATDYSCSPADVPDSMFQVPAGMDCVDMAEMLSGYTQGGQLPEGYPGA